MAAVLQIAANALALIGGGAEAGAAAQRMAGRRFALQVRLSVGATFSCV